MSGGYFWAWMAVAAFCCATGWAETWLVLSAARASAVATGTGLFGWLGCLLVNSSGSRRAAHLSAVRVGSASAACGIAGAGLAALLGPQPTFWVAVVVGLSSPPVLVRVRHHAQEAVRWLDVAGRPDRSTTTTWPSTPAPDRTAKGTLVPAVGPRPTPAHRPERERLDLLSDAELCWAWRVSFASLQRRLTQRDVDGSHTLVQLRQDYLDELERRHAVGFRRWLDAGARPASDPSRYLRSAGRL